MKRGVCVGVDSNLEELRKDYDAVLLAMGAEQPRELPVPGRDLKGVHLAMDYLTQPKQARGSGDTIQGEEISAQGKRLCVVIGGGDTGSDCLGTAHRQAAVLKRINLNCCPNRPPNRADSTPWPLWPMRLRTSHAHEEGCTREWSISTTKFSGENGQVQKLHTSRVEFKEGKIVPVPGSEMDMDVDLVLLAMGFVGPVKNEFLGFSWGLLMMPGGM